MKKSTVAKFWMSTVVLGVLAAGTARAVNWTADGNGDWSDDTKWDATNPNGVGAVADFSTLDITDNRQVTLDANRTVGTLSMGDTAPDGGGNYHSWTFAQGGANTLTFDVPSGNAALNVNQGTTNAIAVPVTLNDSLNATIASGSHLTISGNMTGSSKDLWKSGAGTLRLSGNNSSWTGFVQINGSIGTIEIDNNNALGTMSFRPYSYGGSIRVNNVSGGPLTIPVGRTGYNGGNQYMYFGGGDMAFNGNWGAVGEAMLLVPDADVTVTFNGSFTGSTYATSLQGSGTIILNGTNTQNSRIELGSSVRIGIGTNNAFGTGSQAIYNTSGGAELFAIGGARSVAGDLQLSAYLYAGVPANRLTLSGSNDLTFTGSSIGFWQNTGSPRLNVTGTGVLTLAGNLGTGLNGSGQSIIKEGVGVLAMTGNNSSYTAGIQIDAGVLRANDGAGLSASSLLTLNGGVFETSANLVRTGGSASGNVRITGGTSGFSARGGNVQVAFGTLGSPTSLTWGTAPFQPSTLMLNAATADSKLTFLNPIDLNGATRTVEVADNLGTGADFAEMSGTLTGTGSSGLTKTGNGILVLSGNNSYAGATTVSAGTLLLAGSHAAGDDYTVRSGATLGGGTWALPPIVTGNTVIIEAGGTLSPGSSPGEMQFDNLTIDGSYALDIGDFVDGDYDRVLVAETLTLGASSQLVASQWDNSWNRDAWYPVLQYTGEIGGIGQFASLAGVRNIDYGTINEGWISIQVPEPASLALLALGGLAGFKRRARRG